MSRRGAVVALVAVASLVAACSGNSDTNTSKSGNRTTSTTSPDTPSVTIGIICDTPTDAAQSFEQAWEAGDRAAAARCADDAAVTTIFRTGGRSANWEFEGCESDPGGSTCSYRYEGGSAAFTVRGSDADGWKVAKVVFTAD